MLLQVCTLESAIPARLVGLYKCMVSKLGTFQVRFFRITAAFYSLQIFFFLANLLRICWYVPLTFQLLYLVTSHYKVA